MIEKRRYRSYCGKGRQGTLPFANTWNVCCYLGLKKEACSIQDTYGKNNQQPLLCLRGWGIWGGGLLQGFHTERPPPTSPQVRAGIICSVNYFSRHITQHDSRNVTEDHKRLRLIFFSSLPGVTSEVKERWAKKFTTLPACGLPITATKILPGPRELCTGSLVVYKMFWTFWPLRWRQKEETHKSQLAPRWQFGGTSMGQGLGVSEPT